MSPSILIGIKAVHLCLVDMKKKCLYLAQILPMEPIFARKLLNNEICS